MKKCCLCKNEIKGHGHNPMPAYDGEGKCCNVCNAIIVVPARLKFKKWEK